MQNSRGLLHTKFCRHSQSLSLQLSVFWNETEIEEFYLLLEECITRIANFDDTRLNKEEVERRKKILLHIRSKLGNSALLLSGGASLGMLHIGVTKGTAGEFSAANDSARDECWIDNCSNYRSKERQRD